VGREQQAHGIMIIYNNTIEGERRALLRV